jgi:competence protein ComEC
MKNFVLIVLLLLFVLNIIAWFFVFDLNQHRFLEVSFFDIGQGDAIFIETRQSHQVLIDGGPGSAVLEKLGKEMPFWDRTIDLIVLTHPEHDHYGGLIEVLKRYKIENILWTGVYRDTAEYQEWQDLLLKEGARIFIAPDIQRVTVSGAMFDVLFPFENFEGKTVKNVNDTSLVAKLVFGGNSFLFTGDICKPVEKELLEKETDLDSDFLKVGHHGSKTSSGEEFVAAVSPQVAVIQCGRDNPYGHPHPQTLETLEKYGIKVLRTDKEGDIKIISNGKEYAISYF